MTISAATANISLKEYTVAFYNVKKSRPIHIANALNTQWQR